MKSQVLLSPDAYLSLPHSTNSLLLHFSAQWDQCVFKRGGQDYLMLYLMCPDVWKWFQWHHTIRSVSYSRAHRADTNAPIDPLLQGNFGDAGWKTLEIIGGFKSYSNYNSNCVVLSGCAACLAVREVLREIRTSSCWNATNCSNISMQPYKTWETKLTFTHSELALTKCYNFCEHMNKWNPWTNVTEFLVHWKTEKSCRNSCVSS